MSEISFDIQGLDQLDKAMRSLDRKTRTRVATKALRVGAKIILREAKERVPTGKTGRLKRSLGITTKKTRSRDSKELLILARKGKGTKNDAFYSHMVEFGTSHSKADPFLGPAAKNKAEEAIRAVGNELQRLLIEVT